MSTLKAHFDGHSIVLDEPAALAVGQAVRVIIDSPSESDRDIRAMTDDQNAERLEVETHQLRGVPYNGDMARSSQRRPLFADRVMLPEFIAMSPVPGDSTDDISIDRDRGA